MAFTSVSFFACDLCPDRSDAVKSQADHRFVEPPQHWMRVEMAISRSDLALTEIKHLCPECAPKLHAFFERQQTAEA